MPATPGTRDTITERGTRAAYEMWKTGKFSTLDIARLMEAKESCVYNALHRYREKRREASKEFAA